MPHYNFQHPDGRVISLYQGMNDPHIYIDEDDVEWKRLFDVPNTVIDSVFNIDPRSPQEFVRKTGLRRGKMNDLFQLSAELSEKRAAKEGKDPVKLKSWDKYESSRSKGVIHPDRKKQQLKEAVGKSKHFTLED